MSKVDFGSAGTHKPSDPQRFCDCWNNGAFTKLLLLQHMNNPIKHEPVVYHRPSWTTDVLDHRPFVVHHSPEIQILEAHRRSWLILDHLWSWMFESFFHPHLKCLEADDGAISTVHDKMFTVVPQQAVAHVTLELLRPSGHLLSMQSYLAVHLDKRKDVFLH